MTKSFVKPQLKLQTGTFDGRGAGGNAVASWAQNGTTGDDLSGKWWFRIKGYEGHTIEILNASGAMTYWIKACLEGTTEGVPSKNWHDISASEALGLNSYAYETLTDEWDFVAVCVSGGDGTVKIRSSTLGG